MIFDKLVLEAKKFDLRKIHDQQGPRGMPSQSTVKGLDFFKPTDQTSRKLYDVRRADRKAEIGSIVHPKPVKETEKLVYTGLAIALSDAEQKKVVEEVLSDYQRIFLEMESQLRQAERLRDILERRRKSLEREEQQPISARNDDIINTLVAQIKKLEEDHDKLESYAEDLLKDLQLLEPSDEGDKNELGEIYTQIFNSIVTASRNISKTIRGNLPESQRKDKEAIIEAFKETYRENANSILDVIAGFIANGGERGKDALSKFKINIIIKREGARHGISKKYIMLDPVIALSYVLKYVSNKAQAIDDNTNNPTISLKGASVYKQKADPQLEKIIRVIKLDKSQRDKRILVRAFEELTKIPGTDEAQDILDRYMRGNEDITEASVIRAIRASQPQ